jgi:hypothetical protein
MPCRTPFPATHDIASLFVPRLNDRLLGDFAAAQFQGSDACLMAAPVAPSVIVITVLSFVGDYWWPSRLLRRTKTDAVWA